MSGLVRRLASALDRAEKAGDIGAWLNLAHALYTRQADASPRAELTALADEMWSRAEILRARFRSRAGRLWAAQSVDSILGRLLADELTAGRLSDHTFGRIESLKARTLVDALADPGRGAGAGRQGEAASAAERELMRFEPADPTQTDVLHEEMRLASLLPIGTTWEAGARQRALLAVEAEYERLGVEPPPPAPVASLPDVQSALAEDEAIVEYTIPRIPLHPAARLWSAVVTRRDANLVELADFRLPEEGFIGSLAIDGRAPIDVSPLGTPVVMARTAIREGDDAAAGPHLTSLAATLLAPLVRDGWLAGIRRIVLVPHGVLHYVPFAALPVLDGDPLVTGVAVTLAPSATVWLRTLRAARPPLASLVALGNPSLPYRPDLKPLPEAETELERIVTRLPGVAATAWCGADATESKLAAAAPGAGIVHLATHGDFPEDDALDMQRVLLAPAEGHDGPLHAEEVRSLDMAAARLVALSVCNGGLYRFGPGDEPYGLVPAALAAGTENVLGTLWAIDDRVGRSYVTRLYRGLVADGPAEAVRATAAEFREDGAQIREWAAFVNVGVGRPLVEA